MFDWHFNGGPSVQEDEKCGQIVTKHWEITEEEYQAKSPIWEKHKKWQKQIANQNWQSIAKI